MNKEILLAYTKIPEDRIQDVFHVDPAKQPTQGISRGGQLFRRELLALADHLNTALQRIRCFLQQFSLPCSADQSDLARAQILPCDPNQGGDQLGDPVAAACRVSKIAAKPPPLRD